MSHTISRMGLFPNLDVKFHVLARFRCHFSTTVSADKTIWQSLKTTTCIQCHSLRLCWSTSSIGNHSEFNIWSFIHMVFRPCESFNMEDPFDSIHCEGDTRIPFFSLNQDPPNGWNLFLSSYSYFLAILFLNKSIRYHKVVHLVSDQHIYIDMLNDILDTAQILAVHFTATFNTGGCDFQPFL